MKIVITAGGTSERIDDVRTITNSSTGSLGFAIGTAFAASDEIEKIYYLHGKRAVWPENEKVEPIEIGGVMDLQENLTRVLTENKIDAVIHAMAVSDYMVHQVTTLDKLMGTEDPEHAQGALPGRGVVPGDPLQGAEEQEHIHRGQSGQDLLTKLGVKEGDTITVVGPKTSYNGNAQMKNAFYVSHEAAE